MFIFRLVFCTWLTFVAGQTTTLTSVSQVSFSLVFLVCYLFSWNCNSIKLLVCGCGLEKGTIIIADQSDGKAQVSMVAAPANIDNGLPTLFVTVEDPGALLSSSSLLFFLFPHI